MNEQRPPSDDDATSPPPGDDGDQSTAARESSADADRTVSKDDVGGADTAEIISHGRSEAPRLIGAVIGRYTIRSVIASGGMGTVYEALQESPRRRVALKVMKHGVASRSALRRFEFESELLGRLRHPGIAQVHEAGIHDDGSGGGVPYFAMEYIPNAKSLTQYARDRGLGTRERLELFAKVCEAVHHGHQKGIIHRDLKPANILVDSSGQPKVIDFGVARATDSDRAVTTQQTDIGQLIGTLQYMSPEQCDADPTDLDTRSDVYALGVVLYQLLCDRLPYDLKPLAMHEAARVIREDSPPRPSTFSRVLRGDIETIALKALEKQRERRYQSAHDFAEDLHRFLRGDPIIARPPSISYQLSAFAKRHRTLSIAAVTVMAVTVAALVVVSALWRNAVIAKDAAEHAERETDSALAEATAAKADAENAAEEARAATERAEWQSYLANITAAHVALVSSEPDAVRRHLEACPDEHRGWEWRYLDAQSDNSAVRLAGPDRQQTSAVQLAGAAPPPEPYSMIQAIALASSGSGATTLTTISASRPLTLNYERWDVATGRQLETRPALRRALPNRVLLSSDGDRWAMSLATSTSTDGLAALSIERMDSPIHLSSVPTTWSPRDFSMSDDGRRILAWTDTTAVIWSAESPDPIRKIPLDTPQRKSINLSPDGRWAVVFEKDSAALLWNIDHPDAHRVRWRGGYPEGLRLATFSADSTRLALVDINHVTIVDLGVLEPVAAIRLANDSPVTFAALDRDGGQLLYGWGRQARRLRIDDRHSEALGPHATAVHSGLLTPDGGIALTVEASGTMRTWNSMSGQELATLRAHVEPPIDIRVDENGSVAASLGTDHSVHIWDLTPTRFANVSVETLGADDQMIHRSMDGHIGLLDSERRLTLLSANTGMRLQTALVLEPDSSLVGVSDDGTRALVWRAGSASGEDSADAGRRATLTLNCLRSGDALPTIEWTVSPGGGSYSLSRDATLVAITYDGSTHVIDANSGDILHVIDSPRRPYATRLSARKDQLLILSADNVPWSAESHFLTLWDLQAREQLWEVSIGDPWIWAARFSWGDKSLVAITHDALITVNAATGSLTRQPIESAAFQESFWRSVKAISPDHNRLVTGGQDGVIRIWDSATLDPLLTLRGHTQAIEALEFSRDGTRMMTASIDGTVRLWDSVPYRERYRARREAEAAAAAN